ncbi:MAG: DNA gyrase subunit A [Clostridia bacterium]|nr:DNA gyrase subunit A [Clostridia bacterium]
MSKKEVFEKIDNTKYVDRNLEKEIQESFIDYAMAVNKTRAIPDVRDGLKPVHRRILFTMSEEGMWSDKPHRKCAKIVGDVLGRYHPHGDSSVYDALVRLAQNFTINEVLIDGHGNFGSVDGDEAAAYRYTEARLSKIAGELLRDIDKNTVDFYPNFDNTRTQPTVLPSRFPNLLVNGSDGIAVGMATYIPPHNLGEVIDGAVAIIDDPEISIDDLINIIPAPDFPTGAQVLGLNAIREAYRTGRGGYVIRSNAEIESYDDGKRFRIVVTAIPYQVNKSKLAAQIADLAKNKRIEGISAIRDESNRAGMRLVIDIKKEANAQVVLNQLYKMSQLQISNGITMLCLVGNKPMILNLKQVLEEYLKYQEEIIVRRTKYDLSKAEEREHIIEGLVIAVRNIDRVIKIIKSSADKNDALAKLNAEFDLTERQSNAILEMKLARLTGLEVEKLNNELETLQKIIVDLKDILNSPARVKNIIRTELLENKDKYAKERKFHISYDYDDINIGDLIEKHDVVISLTNQGYVKRLPVSEYKSQNRGGKGVVGHKAKEEDSIVDMFICNSHDDLLFFTDIGKCYSIKAYNIPEASKTAKGRALVNLLQIDQEEKIATVLSFNSASEGSIFMATKNGVIKRTSVKEFENVRKNGKLAIKLFEGDSLVSAKLTNGEDQLIIASDNGKCIRFAESDVRLMGRSSHGVRGMKLDENEHIIDMLVVEENKDVLTVTELGFAKRTAIDEYRLQSRRGKGTKAGKFSDKTGLIVAVKPISEDQDILAITEAGVVIRTHADQINKVGKNSVGVRMMKTGGKKIVSVAISYRQEDEEDVEIESETNETEEN